TEGTSSVLKKSLKLHQLDSFY
nr:hypothetical protein [Tanacetum cinerariifolium]